MTKEIYFKDKVILVDDEDFERVSQYTWNVGKRGYPVANINYKTVTLHRFILEVTDPKILVDHINLDKLDCRRANLRLCTSQQKVWQKGKVAVGNNKYIGVSWCKLRKAWAAYYWHEQKKYHLGAYEREEDAALAYDRAIRPIRGEFAFLNLPDGDDGRELVPKQKIAKRKPKGCSSEFQGVGKISGKPGKWRASVRVDGRPVWIGTFNSEIEAAKAYDQFLFEKYGFNEYLNFPNDYRQAS